MKSVSPLIAIVLVVAITLSLAIAVALWLSGIVGTEGYGSAIVKFGITGNFYTRGNEFYILIMNQGSTNITINRILVNGKYSAVVLEAVNPDTGENRLEYSSNGYKVYVYTGEIVRIHGVVELEFDPGSFYDVRVYTTLGFQASEMLVATPAPLTASVDAYDTMLKYPSDPTRKIALLGFTITNTLNKPIHIYKLRLLDPSDPTKIYYERPVDITVDPRETYKPERVRDFIKIPLKPGKYIVQFQYRIGSEYDSLARFLEINPKPLTIYVINTDDPSRFVDKRLAYQIISSMADVKNITSRKQLYEFFKDPPDDAVIVINLVGATFPIPGPNDIGSKLFVIEDPPGTEQVDYIWWTHINDTYIIDPYTGKQVHVPVWSVFIGESIDRNHLILANIVSWALRYYCNIAYSNWHRSWLYSIDATHNGTYGVLGFILVQEGVSRTISNYTEYVVDMAWIFNDTSILLNNTPTENPFYDVTLYRLSPSDYYAFHKTNNTRYPVGCIAVRRGGGFVIINGWSSPASPQWRQTIPEPLDSEEEVVEFYVKMAIYEAIYIYIAEYVLGGK